MLLAAFDPPGELDDLSPAGRAQWNQYVSARFDEAIVGRPQ